MAIHACVQTIWADNKIFSYSCVIFYVFYNIQSQRMLKNCMKNNLFLQFNHVNIYDNPHNVNNIHSIIIDCIVIFVESASSRSSDEEQGESSYSTRYYLRKRQTDYGSSNDENQSKRRRKLSSKSSSCKGTYWLVQCLLKTTVELDKNLIC